MLTTEQKEWLNHLSDTEKISIIPYNPKNKEVFKLIKSDLIKILGKVRISLCGSTFLGISGQGEIDLYIPVAKKHFNSYLDKLKSYIGKPGSIYELRRVRFVKYLNGIKIEIFLINKGSKDWINSRKFENFLKQNPKYLYEYEKLKSKCNGLSVKQYYTVKVIFINKILNKLKVGI
ncbi:MAG: GrpB family protein [Candidatus Parcubacteria bacterium]|nr:GrpB family protein [Candidatus Parcubacteria bacterium]